ncbi:LAMI_0D03070g1_1 [Lachancea mirantina]|uniref:Dolichol phosphate-mannose biosynthesis regulatory protein n=1 Tax=Lachancea mirantina TaxID=1230905 RepID=A0A1G4J9F4_9SACH|nr:LAMI_0D03070g1_1 [Lachancea mirantina]
MNRFLIVVVAFAYYCVWIGLPIFDGEGKVWFFPLPSSIAVLVPAVLLLCGTLLVGTFSGLLLLLHHE